MAGKKPGRDGPAGPFVLHFSDAKVVAEGGLQRRTLVRREDTEVTKSEAVRLNRGQKTAEQSHPDEEEAYLIISGKGEVVLDGKTHPVAAHAFVWVPRNCKHFVRAAADSAMEYVYFAVFPDEGPKHSAK